MQTFKNDPIEAPSKKAKQPNNVSNVSGSTAGSLPTPAPVAKTNLLPALLHAKAEAALVEPNQDLEGDLAGDHVEDAAALGDQTDVAQAVVAGNRERGQRQ